MAIASDRMIDFAFNWKRKQEPQVFVATSNPIVFRLSRTVLRRLTEYQ